MIIPHHLRRLSRYALATFLALGISVCQGGAAPHNPDAVSDVAHTLTVELTADPPDTTVIVKVNGSSAGQVPLKSNRPDPQLVTVEHSWPPGHMSLSISPAASKLPPHGVPPPKLYIYSVIVDNMRFFGPLDPGTVTGKHEFNLDINLPKSRPFTETPSASPHFLLSISSNSAKDDSPALAVSCDDRPADHEFVVPHLDHKVLRIPISLDLCAGSSRHTLSVRLASSEPFPQWSLLGHVELIGPDGDLRPLTRVGGEPSNATIPGEFELNAQTLQVDYETPDPAALASKSAPPAQQPTPPKTTANPRSSASVQVLSEKLQVQSQRLDTVFYLEFIAAMLGVGAAVLSAMTLMSAQQTNRQCARLKAALDSQLKSRDQAFTDLKSQLHQRDSEPHPKPPSGGTPLPNETLQSYYDSILQRMDSRFESFSHLLTQATPSQSQIAPHSDTLLADRVTTRSTQTPKRALASSFTSPRLADVIEEYDEAVRDHQDALNFAEKHAVKMLDLQAGRLANKANSVLVPLTQDPLAASFWAVQSDDRHWWVFPGFSLYSQRGALSAGGWHHAKEKLAGVFELKPGTGFLKTPATAEYRSGKYICQQPGRIELPAD